MIISFCNVKFQIFCGILCKDTDTHFIVNTTLFNYFKTRTPSVIKIALKGNGYLRAYVNPEYYEITFCERRQSKTANLIKISFI